MYLKKLKAEADTEIQLSSSKPTTAIFHKNIILKKWTYHDF